MKKMQKKYFQKTIRIFLYAKVNDDTKPVLANAAQQIKNPTALKYCVMVFLANKNSVYQK